MQHGLRSSQSRKVPKHMLADSSTSWLSQWAQADEDQRHMWPTGQAWCSGLIAGRQRRLEAGEVFDVASSNPSAIKQKWLQSPDERLCNCSGEEEAKLLRAPFRSDSLTGLSPGQRSGGLPVGGDSSSGCSFTMDPIQRERDFLLLASRTIHGRLCIASSFPSALPPPSRSHSFLGIWPNSKMQVHSCQGCKFAQNTQCSVHAALQETVTEITQAKTCTLAQQGPPCAAVLNFLLLTFRLTSWPWTPAGVLSLCFCPICSACFASFSVFLTQHLPHLFASFLSVTPPMEPFPPTVCHSYQPWSVLD